MHVTFVHISWPACLPWFCVRAVILSDCRWCLCYVRLTVPLFRFVALLTGECGCFQSPQRVLHPGFNGFNVGSLTVFSSPSCLPSESAFVPLSYRPCKSQDSPGRAPPGYRGILCNLSTQRGDLQGAGNSDSNKQGFFFSVPLAQQ